jgi:hypothetical protein
MEGSIPPPENGNRSKYVNPGVDGNDEIKKGEMGMECSKHEKEEKGIW